ncbi:GHKL domain-containing protein [Algoriphagus sp. NBT04N3]|jgi:signal transduction histidine kinase|uniref:ATP-binding protein n=1 Tax=Algoriphagus sp. NBT04N3 TaxID=2705473 RepID=UPI001C6258C0|nr:ATP-binding protein [Algoriphagus sp. NBT04N3]QYH40854.1 GHKL domain-containing protein [Algoriphagus sp. NBT04N3]
MERSKKELLEKTYREFMKVGLESNEPNLLEGLVDENVMGFGTAMDEKILGIEEFKKLLNNQKIQSESLDITWRNEPVHRFISEDENSAVFAENIYATIKTGEEAVEMYMRFSTVLNYSGKQWKVVHWHGSKPEEVVSEKDTWGIDIWKQKTEELEKLVKEKTADLLEKNRELEIEAALERIRARTMAMQSSDELAATASLLFQELQSLGISTYSSGFTIWDEEQKHLISWMCNADGSMNPPFRILIEENDWHKRQFESWKKGESFLKKDFSGKEMQDYFKYLHSFPMLKKAFQKSMDAGFPLPERQIHHVANFASGNLLFITLEPLSGAQALFQRFAKVFEQTYTRFLDLEKAENQAREAQIETCLERVRSASLAMHQTDELANVVSVLFSQFAELKLEFYQVWINIFMLEEGVSNCWFSPVEEVIDEPYTAIVPLAPFEDSSIKSWRGGEKFSYLSWKGKKEVDKIMDELSKMTGHPSFKQIQKKKKMNRMEVIDCNHKYGVVALAKNSDITEEDHSILLRFTKVFEQAYIRFLDLEKAEFQAREATIEAALEKVRSRSLAMHKSDELNEVVAVLFEKLKDLEIPFTAVGIATGIEDSKDLNAFVCGQNEGGLVITNYRLPYFENPVPKDLYHALEKQLDFFEGHYSKEEKDAFYHHLIEHTEEFKQLPEDILQMIFNSEAYCISMIAVKNAVFNINDFEGKSLAQHEIDTIKRFAKVFEQAYTRFLDLQKAEAQARESEIQLALERVRARSMAMKSTDELHEVLSVLFRQFDQLGIHPMNVFLSLFDRENRTLTYRASGKSKHRQPQKQVVHVDSMEELKGIYDKFINDKSDSVEVIFYSKEVLPQVFEIFSETFDAMPEDERMKLEYFPDGGYSMAGYTPFGYLGYDHLRPASPEEKEILSRFCKEFTRVYQRFLDIQKAEAQAREAQIEVALERIRARAMAMHHPDELSEVLALMFDQLSHLGVDAHWTHLTLINLENNTFIYRMTSKDGKPVHAEQVVQLDAMDTWSHTVETFKSQNPETITHIHFSPDVLPRVWELFDGIFSSLPEESKINPNDFPNGIHTTEANCKFGYLGINQSREATTEEKKILGRFGSEFGRLYQRYLDIEKAQKQAREAQIEASLERVRARAMAMHQTDELTDVLCVLFDQFDLLGINPVLTHLTLFDEANETFSIRLTTTADNGVVAEQLIDIHAIEAWNQAFAQWKSCEPNSVNTIDYAPEDLPYLWELLSEVMSALPEGHKINPEDFPNGLFTTQGHFQFGYLGFNHSRKATEEEKNIVSRFAREFGRTYQRFLDLEKAEAQAKEAQIEAALEKVRSRSMGMQNTMEMQLVANEMREQLLALGVPLDAMAMSGVIENDSDYDVWVGGAISEKPLRITHSSGTQVQREYNQVIKERPELFMKTYSGKVMKEYYQQLLDTNSFNPEIEKFMKESSAFTTTLTFMKNSGLQILRYTDEPFSDSDNQIVIRFGKVFEQAYIRFLDLQKAEAQAREARIEAALEKIRSRTMGMQSSAELPEVANLLFLEVQALGIPAWSCGYNILAEDKKTATCCMSSEGTLQTPFQLRLYGEASFDEMGEFIQSDDTMLVQELGGKALEEHYTYMKSFPDLKPTFDEIERLGLSLPTYQINHLCKFNQGFILFITYEKVPDSQDIFKRFTKVFDQTYTRFLDLKKAEKQAQESKIEAALERIRSRAMAMQTSDELKEVALELRTQMGMLGQKNLEVCAIHLYDLHPNHFESWGAMHPHGSESEIMQSMAIFPKSGSLIIEEMMDYYASDQSDYVLVNEGKKYKQWFELMKEHAPEIYWHLSKAKADTSGDKLKAYWAMSEFSGGALIMVTYSYPDEDSRNLLRRTANVFGLAYKRFRDLKRAEEQAREAQIEAALERIRSHSMGMQSAADFGVVTTEMFDQLRNFGEDLFAAGIVFCDKHEGHVEQWHSIPGGGMLSPFIVPIDLDYIHQYRYDQWKAGKELFSIEIPGDFIEQHFKDIFDLPSAQVAIKDLESRNAPMPAAPPWEIDYGASFKNGYILISSLKYLETTDILPRFAKVFEQAYTRFLDLQKAEEQARNAQIEASMERVRARAMSMQKPDELVDVATLLRKEMGLLGVEELETSSIYIHHADEETTECWYAIQDDKKLISDYMTIRLEDTWVGREMLSFYQSGSSKTSIKMQGQHRTEWISYCAEKSHHFSIQEFYGNQIPERTYHLYKFSQGFMGAASPGEISDESWKLLKRAASVFSLAYTRFSDLKQAEAQAREAQIEAALERVRSRTMGMQRSEELSETASVLFEQLQNLGVTHERINIGIINEKNQTIDFWITAQGGNKLDSRFSGRITEETTLSKAYQAWKKGKKSLVIDLQGKELDQWLQFMKEEIRIPFNQKYQHNRRVQTVGFFSKGMLVVTSPEPLYEEALYLLEKFAGVFDLTYTRFTDLKIAEANAVQAEKDLEAIKLAKSKAESALKELKATQEQLIQQEKLASLGQLTAGIAHEIKNPLNFVNNFSELSKELIEEVFDELAKLESSDIKEDIIDILTDVKSNLTKVHEHGSRADGIVKSMLQHSRGGAGKASSIGINELVREFSNLAFHGMRAGKNPINVNLNFDLDENAGEATLVMEDFSRVILNIANNAFDAMRDKLNSSNNGEYLPSLDIKTKRQKNQVLISIQDNGPGIPDDIKDKILQPFFTTKKGTEGTGLGLSITNDIIKAHGGRLDIQSQPGQTIFNIHLKL